jgi:uncharacterized FlaG/YvyC family protein
MENLTKFIALEKLVQAIGHGTVDLELQLRAGKIVGITATGNKKTVYNSSDKDINDNKAALEYIVKRINQQLATKAQSELTFKVSSNSDKIKVVQVESKQTIK